MLGVREDSIRRYARLQQERVLVATSSRLPVVDHCKGTARTKKVDPRGSTKLARGDRTESTKTLLALVDNPQEVRLHGACLLGRGNAPHCCHVYDTYHGSKTCVQAESS